MADHLTLLSAGREKRIYAVPPYTRVEPLVFDDMAYRVEEHGHLTCGRTRRLRLLHERDCRRTTAPRASKLSDSNFGVKAIRRREGEPVAIGDTWYRNGRMSP